MPASLTELRQQAEAERDRAIAAANERYNAVIAKIDELETLLGGVNVRVASVPAETPATSNGNRVRIWPGLRSALRDALERMPDQFRLDDIESALTAKYPSQTRDRRALSVEMWRLVRDAHVRCLEKGGAHKPALYGKVNGKEHERQVSLL